MLNLKALHYALLLNRMGSFSEAARHSNVSQSAISQQISKLEEEIGVTLFDRQTKPLGLTAAGKGFLERAESIVLEAEQLWDYAEKVAERKEGHINLGVIPTVSPYLSPLFLHDLEKAYPLLTVSIYEMKTLDIIRGLTDRSVQAGIMATPISSSLNLIYDTLFYERFYIYTSAKSRLAKRKKIDLKELMNDEIWLLNEGNCLSDQITSICSMKNEVVRESTHSYHTDSLDALLNFIAHTDGLTVMPELATMGVSAQNEDLIKRISGKKLGREISMVSMKGSATSHLTHLVVDNIRKNLPASMLAQDGMEIIDPKISA